VSNAQKDKVSSLEPVRAAKFWSQALLKNYNTTSIQCTTSILVHGMIKYIFFDFVNAFYVALVHTTPVLL
jgi:hypothetical protein